MKGLKKRLIVIPQGKFKHRSLEDFVLFLRNIMRTVDEVDSDLHVKQCFDQVLLKEKRIRQFKGKSVNEFHLNIIEQINSNGTQFLISKN